MLQKISENKGFANYKEIVNWYTQLSTEEKQKIKDKNDKKTKPIYIVFPVSKNEWKDWYGKGNHSLIGTEGDKMLVGLVMVKQHYDERTMPLGTREMTNEELRQYQLWCELYNNYPQPMRIA